jgi:acyl carrier protein
MNISKEVKRIIAASLKVRETLVTDNACLRKDLHADEIDFIELIMKLEERFGIEIPDEQADNIFTVSEAVKYIKKVLNE